MSTVSNPSGGLLPPTITICPGERYEVGWKNSSGELVNLIRAECENFDDNKAILNCVGNKTYNFTDTVKMAFVGSVNPKNLMNQIYWSKYMAVTAYGNCHVLKYEEPIGVDVEKYSLFLYLNPELDYNIYFHDQKYFFTTHNLLAIPQARKRKQRKEGLTTDKRFDFYPLVITEKKNMNRQEQSCEEDVRYDFYDCVIENIAAKVGCRYPWDDRPHSKVPVCTTIDKIEEQEGEFFKLAISDKKDLSKMTGCNPPCWYREYKIFTDEMEGFLEGYGVGIIFLSREYKLEEEAYVYPFISFVAEFGGALGMFLGFSFLMVWDFIYALIKVMFDYIK